mgnify:CR=1 FL=1
MRVHEETLAHVRALVARLQAVPNGFYVSRLAGIHPEDIRTEEDFLSLPFTDKNDLRSAYPLGLAAVPPREIVRVHASSGTTGAPVVIPYTKKDIADWADMMARSLAIAGVGPDDRLQIATGFGMWTAGSGFQTGIERLGAMAIPAGPGNTARQLRFLIDMEATVLCATASYALQLGEEAQKRGLLDQLRLKKAIIGAEHWTQKTGEQIANLLGVEIYDMYGLTEIYGPGTGVSCAEHDGMHMLDEMLLYEVIDPHTLRPVPDGETGELVITTLFKEGAPLLRYRTGDYTRFLPPCPCGGVTRRIDRVSRRGEGPSMEKLDEALFRLPGLVDCRAEFDGVLKISARALEPGLEGDIERAVSACFPGLPVKLIGVGEGMEDLRPFMPQEFAAALFQS